MGSLELIRWNQNRDDNRWAPVLCRNLHPCQIMHPLVEIATWLPNPNPTPNPNPSPTPTPKPTNTRGCIIWQGAEFGTTPANEIVVCALAPPTSGVLKSWRIPKELRYFDRIIQQRISFTCSASILHVMKDSLALYLSLRARARCVCVWDKATVSRALHTTVYGTSNTATLLIHSDELKNKMIIIL